MADSTRSLAKLGRFTAFYCRSAGRPLAVTLALRFLLGLTQGIGLVAVLPMLAALGYLPDVSIPANLRPITDFLQSALPEPKLVFGLLIFVLASALIAGGRYAEAYVKIDIEQTFVLRLRTALFEQFLAARWDHLVMLRGSDVSHTLMADVSRVALTARHALTWMIGAVTALFYIVAALYVELTFSAVALAAGLPLLWILRRRNRQFSAIGSTQRERMRTFFGLIHDQVQGLKLVKSLNLEAPVVREAADVMQQVRDDQVRLGRLTARVGWIYDVGTAVVVSAFIWLGLVGLELSPAVVVMVVLIFARLYPQLSGLVRTWQTVLNGMPSFEAYHRSLEDLSDHAESASLRDDLPVLPAFRDGLRLVDVDFHYSPGDDHAALQGISAHIRAQRTYALVGPSGAGKTTLGDLLLGLLEPTSGRVVLDGKDLDGELLAGWRRRVAYVPQETFLFHDTIARNLRWVRPDAAEEELWDALEEAAAADFVRSLPQGLSTVIGDRGHRLSGGERQRIALARALLRRPLFLLLDEATSALDSENERRIQEAIQRLHHQVTLVIIAHRLSTVQHADEILVLENGRLVQRGSWAELSLQDGWFGRALEQAEVP